MSTVALVDNPIVQEESSKSATSWGPVIAGGVAAAAATLVLTLIGSGLGLTAISPFSGEGVSLETFSAGAAIWLVIVQWLSALLAGYIAGRLRTRWVNLHTDEVFFRDTAHGFLAWALATLMVAWLLSASLASMIGAGVQATTTATGAATGAAATVASQPDTTSYFTDALLRPANPAASPATTSQGANGDQAAGEISRILLTSAANGEMAADDRAYLDKLVAARTGLAPADAKARVDAVMARIDQAKAIAKETADKARKAGAIVALAGALSLIIGAFIAASAAALGGRLRENEGALMAR